MKTLFIILSLLITSNVFAHGEDKLGPNNGFIRMPGTFHIELVPQMEGTFLVFLLDLQNKNATIKNSFVKLKIKNEKNTIDLSCRPMEDHFICTNSRKFISLPNTQIIVEAKRLGIDAKEASYDFPLKLKTGKNSNESHDMNKM